MVCTRIISSQDHLPFRIYSGICANGNIIVITVYLNVNTDVKGKEIKRMTLTF